MLENGGSGGGAVLADELGLGKTLSAIALLTLMKKALSSSSPAAPVTVLRVLVLCPAVVVPHWVSLISL